MEKIRCSQCTMTFRREFRPRANNHRCPDCKRPFWEVDPGDRPHRNMRHIRPPGHGVGRGTSALIYDTVKGQYA